ncbi:SDR family oxidoreductase [Neisseriaceae bacterium ESL0693]|nr:SDR family oxidoreductase [Neisseriaceae bacterium ESL0693]
MNIDLSDKTAIITGSTKGIGLATAKGLAGCGAKVVVNGRTQQAVDQAIQAIKEVTLNSETAGVVADLSTADGCAALVKAHPACDILVNNLGIFKSKDFFDTTDDDWTHFFNVNIMSGIRLARAYLPGMKQQNWGRMIFLSSESAFNIPVDMIHYGVTKTAYTALARGLAKRMAGTGVTVNSVLPGPTLSEGVEAMLETEVKQSGRSLTEVGQEFVQHNRPSSIIQRLASVDEVANMIVYLCSPQASATTGAAVRVDGGVVDSL